MSGNYFELKPTVPMIQKEFAERMIAMLKEDNSVTGLAAGGSWITNEMDESREKSNGVFGEYEIT